MDSDEKNHLRLILIQGGGGGVLTPFTFPEGHLNWIDNK